MTLILATAFLDILGMSILLPSMPSIIEMFAMAPAWTSYSQVFYAVGMFLGGLFFGKLSDTKGRKKMLTYTSILNLFWYIWMFLGIYLVQSGIISPQSLIIGFSIFLFARFIGGLGGAGFGVIQAYISDISAPEERAKNMGYIGAAFGMAFLIGPAIWGILSKNFGILWVLSICTVVIALNVLSIKIFLKEPKKHTHTEEVDLIHFHFSQKIITLLSISFGSVLAFASIQFISNQFYVDRFGFDAEHIGYTMAAVGIIAVVYQIFFIKHVRKYFWEIEMIRGAFLLLFIGFIAFGMNTSVLGIFLLIWVFPLGMGTSQPAISAIIAKNAGREVWKVMGYNTSIQSVGNIFWPLLAGLLYIKPGTALPFFVSAGIFGILFLISFSWKLRK